MGDPIWPALFPDGGIVFAVPVAATGGEVVGTIEALVSLAPVRKLLEGETKREVLAYVVDRRGKLIVASEPGKVAPGEALLKVEMVREFVAHPVRLTKSYVHGEGKGARKVLGTVAPVDLLDWGVLVEKDEDKAYALVNRTIREAVRADAQHVSWTVTFLLAPSANSICTPST